MLKTKVFFLSIVAYFALSAAPAHAELSARQIVEKTWWAGKLDGVEMISTLTIINAAGKKRVRKTAAVSILKDGGKTEKRLLRFLSPPDVKGTGLLSFDYEQKDDDIWFFLPSMRKTRRIVSSEKSKNFMGSEFTYSDMTPPAVDDFTHKLLRSEKVGKTDCYVVELKPKTKKIAKEIGYSRRINWIGKVDFVIRKATIFDHKDKLLKELTVSRVREIDKEKHRFRPMDLHVVNKQNGRSSRMTVNKIKLRKGIPDKYFTVRYLERI